MSASPQIAIVVVTEPARIGPAIAGEGLRQPPIEILSRVEYAGGDPGRLGLVAVSPQPQAMIELSYGQTAPLW